MVQSTIRACSYCGNLAEGELLYTSVWIGTEIQKLFVLSKEFQTFSQLSVQVHTVDYIMFCKGNYLLSEGIGPEQLNFSSLKKRLIGGGVKELILALGNDLESEATCNYLQDEIIDDHEIKVSRIGFGLPSGGGVTFADELTLRNALESRKDLRT